MDVNHFELSYNQMGLIATVELSECEENFVAWQRFLPNGVIALLPVADNLSSIVWSTQTNDFKRLMQLNETEFIDAVNNAFVRIQFEHPRETPNWICLFVSVAKVREKFRGRNGDGHDPIGIQ